MAGEDQRPPATTPQQNDDLTTPPATTGAIVPFEPENATQLAHLSQWMAKSGNLPAIYKRPADVFVAAMAGRDFNMSPMQSLRAFHVIEGRPSLSADAKVAILKKRPDVCEYFRVIETSAKVATYETKRKGDPPVRLTFTIEEAQQAGLAGKDNWKKYPAAMLRARCKSMLSNAVYEDLFFGTYDPDEIDDMPAVQVASTPLGGQHQAPPPAPGGPAAGQTVSVTPQPQPVPGAAPAGTTPPADPPAGAKPGPGRTPRKGKGKEDDQPPMGITPPAPAAGAPAPGAAPAAAATPAGAAQPAAGAVVSLDEQRAKQAQAAADEKARTSFFRPLDQPAAGGTAAAPAAVPPPSSTSHTDDLAEGDDMAPPGTVSPASDAINEISKRIVDAQTLAQLDDAVAGLGKLTPGEADKTIVAELQQQIIPTVRRTLIENGIAAAKTVAELQTMIDAIKALPRPEPFEAVRVLYGNRKAALAAAAPGK